MEKVILQGDGTTKDNVECAHHGSHGVYQFIEGTWKNYCEGNVFDYKANIACFMELYPKHPSWWECK